MCYTVVCTCLQHDIMFILLCKYNSIIFVFLLEMYAPLYYLEECDNNPDFNWFDYSKGQTSVFKCTVDVNGQTFEGRSNSKKGAKQVAAEMALKSFVQFSDASEAHQVEYFF